jgi:hypothetical protein
MSYTIVLAVYPGNKVEDYAELSNAWGSAPIVWQFLYNHFVPHEEFSYIFKPEEFQKVTALWDDETVPEYLRVVLGFTFDRVYVLKANYARMAKDIRHFLADLGSKPNSVNHWRYLADLFELSPDIPAIGLYCTSVSSNPFVGEWDEETEEYEPLNWATTYELYESLNSDDSELDSDLPHPHPTSIGLIDFFPNL